MNILILEEENALRDAVRDALGGNHTIQFAESGQQGFYMASANRYDLMITNIVVPGWNGYKSIDALGTICPKLPVLIWTKAPPDSVRSGLGNRANVTAIVRKQDGIDSLVDAVERAVGGESGGTDNLAKIVCTLGPASCSREIIGHMMLAGMDVARLNFSHGTHADHAETLKEIRAAEEEWNKKVAVLQDLCGPKIRIGEVTGDGCILEKGAIFTIHADDTPGDSDGAGISVPEVLADINPGDPVLLDDGQIELVAEKAVENGVVCRVVEGGLLKSHKGMNLPATRLRLPSVTEKIGRAHV
jgi:pyruvate kinase